MRVLALLLLFPFISCLSAQDTAAVPRRTIPAGYAHTLAFQVDQGATATAVMCSVTIHCQSQSGVKVRLLDTDAKTVLGSGTEQEDQVGGAGTVVVNLQMPARSGRHPLVVILQPVLPGTISCYGSVNTDAGTLAMAGAESTKALVHGLTAPLDMFAVFRQDFDVPADFTSTVEVDYGPTTAPMTFAIEGAGRGLTEIRVYDVTGGDVLLGSITAAPSGIMQTSNSFTTPAYAGSVTLRVQVVGDGFAGDVFWALWLPNDHPVTGLGGNGVSKQVGGAKKEGGSCAAASGGGAAWIAAIVFALFRRRKRRYTPRRD
ncbi:MAG: hypothetical protein IPK87_01310 [Planctomycetes bacterium]|nr:hypothetical protein [Planctomycetota bacterium]